MRWPRLPRHCYMGVTSVFLLLLWYYLFIRENVNETRYLGHIDLGDYDHNIKEDVHVPSNGGDWRVVHPAQPKPPVDDLVVDSPVRGRIVQGQNQEEEIEEESEDSISEQAKTRTSLYCNPPEAPVEGSEGEVAPGYQLEHVHIIIRHGDRSPIYSIPKYGMPKLDCRINLTSMPSDAKMADYLSVMEKILHQEPLSSHAHRFGLYPHSPVCEGAQLTGTGAYQHLKLGRHLHSAYIDKWNLLTEASSFNKLQLVSTEYSRTYQSAIAFLFGFLPKFNFQKLRLKFAKNVQFCDERLSGLGCMCPLAAKLRLVVEKEYHKRSTNSSLHNSIKREISNTLGVPIGKLLWLGAIMDTMMGYGCHGESFPCSNNNKMCISWDLMARMWSFMDSNGRSQVASYANMKMSRLLMHPLLHEILHRMQNVTNNLERTRLVLYSGHDVTVSPLAIALGIHYGQWPPYASRLIFELYSKSSSKGAKKKYFLRVLFNGEDRTQQVRFCKKSALKDGVCPFENFARYVIHEDMQSFNKNSYAQACSTSYTSNTGGTGILK